MINLGETSAPLDTFSNHYAALLHADRSLGNESQDEC